MSEANPNVKPRKPEVSSFEKFEAPRLETPAAIREFAERGISQAKENYEKMKTAAEEATSYFESTYTTASKGAADYGLKLIETARANTNAAFDYTSELLGARSLSEVVELSTAHARKQFDALQAQARELTSLAQRIVTDTTEPIKEGVSRAMKKVA